MALVVFLRGVNVGGHRAFRPTELARALRRFDVVNIGAAGTFVVRRPGTRRELRAAIAKALPFETEIVVCDGALLRRLVASEPFGAEPPEPGVVRFASFLAGKPAARPTLPILVPGEGWLVRVVAVRDGVAFGEYRRHMHTIRYLGQLDRLLGAATTTRNWNTVASILRRLDGPAAR